MGGVDTNRDLNNVKSALECFVAGDSITQRRRLEIQQEAADSLREFAEQSPSDVAEHIPELVVAIDEEFHRDYASVEAIATDYEEQSDSIVSTLLYVLSEASVKNENNSAVANPEYVELFLELDAEGFSSAMWCLKNVAKETPELIECHTDRIVEAINEVATSRAQAAMLVGCRLVRSELKVEPFVNNIDTLFDILASVEAENPTPGPRERKFSARLISELAMVSPRVVLNETELLLSVLSSCEEDASHYIIRTFDNLCSTVPEEAESIVTEVTKTASNLPPDQEKALLLTLAPVATSNPDSLDAIFSRPDQYLIDASDPVFVAAGKLLTTAGADVTTEVVAPRIESILDRLNSADKSTCQTALRLLDILNREQPRRLVPYLDRLQQATQGKSENVKNISGNILRQNLVFTDDPDWAQIKTDQVRLNVNSRNWSAAKALTNPPDFEEQLKLERAYHDLSDPLDWSKAIDSLGDNAPVGEDSCKPILHTFLDDPTKIDRYIGDIIDFATEADDQMTLLRIMILGIPYWESEADSLTDKICHLIRSERDERSLITLINLLNNLNDYRHDVVVDILTRMQSEFRSLCGSENFKLQRTASTLVGFALCKPSDCRREVSYYLDILVDQCSADTPWMRGLAAENLKDVADNHPDLLLEHISGISQLLSDSDVGARSWGTYTIGRLAEYDPEAVEHLTGSVVSSLRHTNADVRAVTATTIVQYADQVPDTLSPYIEDLIPCVRDRDPSVRKPILQALVQYADKRSIDPLIDFTSIFATNITHSDEEILESTIVLLTDIAAHSPQRFLEQTNGQTLAECARNADHPSDDVSHALARLVALHRVCGNLSDDSRIDSKAQVIVEDWLDKDITNLKNDEFIESSGETATSVISVGHNTYQLSDKHRFCTSNDQSIPSLVPSAVVNELDSNSVEMRKRAAAAFLTLCEERPEIAVSSISALEPRLRDVDPDIRRFALLALSALREEVSRSIARFADSIADQLTHPDEEARAAACVLLRTVAEDRLRLLRDRAGDIAVLVSRSSYGPTIRNGVAVLGLLTRNGVQTNGSIAQGIETALSTPEADRIGAVAFYDYVQSISLDDTPSDLPQLLDTAMAVVEDSSTRESETIVSILKGIQHIAQHSPQYLDERLFPIAQLLTSPYDMGDTVERLSIDIVRRVTRKEPQSGIPITETIISGVKNLDPGSSRHRLCIDVLHTIVVETSHHPASAVRPLIATIGENGSSPTAAKILYEIVSDAGDPDPHGIDAIVPHLSGLFDVLDQADNVSERHLLLVFNVIAEHDPTLTKPHAEQLLERLHQFEARSRGITVTCLYRSHVDQSILTEYIPDLSDTLLTVNESFEVSVTLLLLYKAARADPRAVASEIEAVTSRFDSGTDQGRLLASRIVVRIAKSGFQQIPSAAIKKMVGSLSELDDESGQAKIARLLDELSSEIATPFTDQVDQLVELFLQTEENPNSVQSDVHLGVSNTLTNIGLSNSAALEPHIGDLIDIWDSGLPHQRKRATRIFSAIATDDVSLVAEYCDLFATGLQDDDEDIRRLSCRIIESLASDDAAAAVEYQTVIRDALEDPATRLSAARTIHSIVDEHPSRMEPFYEAVIAELTREGENSTRYLTEAVRISIRGDGIRPTGRLVEILARKCDSSQLLRDRVQTLAVAARRDPNTVSHHLEDRRRIVDVSDPQTLTYAMDTLSALPSQVSDIHGR